MQYEMPVLEVISIEPRDFITSSDNGFEGDEHNTVSISDFIEYADILATSDELSMQHSHFQTDIRRMKTQSRKENDVDFDN